MAGFKKDYQPIFLLSYGMPVDELIDWDLDDVPTADCKLEDSASGNLNWTANWPTSNSAWGSGDALNASINKSRFGADDIDCTGGETAASIPLAKFYDGDGNENPSSDPNWFYYYKSNAGGGTYLYSSTGNNRATLAGGESTIRITSNTYPTMSTYITEIRTNRLAVTGTKIFKYYSSFLKTLAHEREHALNQVLTTHAEDTDDDYMKSSFETSTSLTLSNDKYSARDWGGVYTISYLIDGESYAFRVGQLAGDAANTSNDWAHPGSNWE